MNTDDLNSVVSNLRSIIQGHKFKIVKENIYENGVSLEAIYGSRFIAFVMHFFIPVLGHHLPAGKRLCLKTSVVNEGVINFSINISPYMEMLNETEVLGLSQTAGEKASDEYFAAHKVHVITKDLFTKLKLEIPIEFSEFKKKALIADIWLGLLIYPLDGYKAVKRIHIPSKKGPKWSWPAFFIPEIWFVWHEIWGVSFLIILVEVFGIGIVASFGTPVTILAMLFVLIRSASARIGNTIFYYKYGRWSSVSRKKQFSNKYEPPPRH